MTTPITRKSTYTLQFSRINGSRLKSTTRFISCKYQLVANAIGQAEVLLLDEDYPQLLRSPSEWVDSWLEIWRGPYGRSEQLEGDTIWLMEGLETYSLAGRLYYHLFYYDAKFLLDYRTLPYAAGSAQASKNVAADDLMKAVVNENHSSSATDVNRRISTSMLTVEQNRTQGQTADMDIHNTQVLQICQKAAQYSAQFGKPIYFDVVLANIEARTLEFRTYLGQRGQARTVTFSEDKQTLTNVRLKEDYSRAKSYVYAAGKGQKSLQLLGTAQDATFIATRPLGRREVMVNANNALDQSGADSEAQAALRNYRPVISLSGNVVDSPDSPYGVAWKHGDSIPVEHLGRLFTANIDVVDVNVTRSSESVSAAVRVTSEL